MSYSVYYSYDASHRMTRQYTDGAAPTPEAHYFTYNERDMVTQIQDVTASPDTNRYFTYNAVGERVVAVDGAGPTYWTYDGAKLLTEKDTTGSTLRRYRHNLSQLDQIGSAVEISDGANLYYPAFAQDGSTTRLQSPKISTGEQLTSKVYYAAYGNRVAAAFSPATTERLQALSGIGLNRLTTTQEVYVGPNGQAMLPGLGIVMNPMGGWIWNPSRVTSFLDGVGAGQGQQGYKPPVIGQYVVDGGPTFFYQDSSSPFGGGGGNNGNSADDDPFCCTVDRIEVSVAPRGAIGQGTDPGARREARVNAQNGYGFWAIIKVYGQRLEQCRLRQYVSILEGTLDTTTDPSQKWRDSGARTAGTGPGGTRTANRYVEARNRGAFHEALDFDEVWTDHAASPPYSEASVYDHHYYSVGVGVGAEVFMDFRCEVYCGRVPNVKVRGTHRYSDVWTNRDFNVATNGVTGSEGRDLVDQYENKDGPAPHRTLPLRRRGVFRTASVPSVQGYTPQGELELAELEVNGV